MDRWEPVQRQLDDFRRFLYSGFPPLVIREGYDHAWDGVGYRQSRKDGRYGCCGVYLFFDAAGTLLYVGKAIWAFDKRIWTHKIDGAKYIDLIPFDDQHAPFLLALEHFLICRLKPTWNTVGIGYEVPLLSGGCPPVIEVNPATASGEGDANEIGQAGDDARRAPLVVPVPRQPEP